AADGDVQLCAHVHELSRGLVELLRELAPEIEDARGGGAQLRVLLRALLNGGFVDGFGIAALAGADPPRERAANEIVDAREQSHGLPPLSAPIAYGLARRVVDGDAELTHLLLETLPV